LQNRAIGFQIIGWRAVLGLGRVGVYSDWFFWGIEYIESESLHGQAQFIRLASQRIAEAFSQVQTRIAKAVVRRLTVPMKKVIQPVNEDCQIGHKAIRQQRLK
jgi:hypothetical protein